MKKILVLLTGGTIGSKVENGVIKFGLSAHQSVRREVWKRGL